MRLIDVCSGGSDAASPTEWRIVRQAKRRWKDPDTLYLQMASDGCADRAVQIGWFAAWVGRVYASSWRTLWSRGGKKLSSHKPEAAFHTLRSRLQTVSHRISSIVLAPVRPLSSSSSFVFFCRLWFLNISGTSCLCVLMLWGHRLFSFETSDQPCPLIIVTEHDMMQKERQTEMWRTSHWVEYVVCCGGAEGAQEVTAGRHHWEFWCCWRSVLHLMQFNALKHVYIV